MQKEKWSGAQKLKEDSGSSSTTCNDKPQHLILTTILAGRYTHKKEKNHRKTANVFFCIYIFFYIQCPSSLRGLQSKSLFRRGKLRSICTAFFLDHVNWTTGSRLSAVPSPNTVHQYGNSSIGCDKAFSPPTAVCVNVHHFFYRQVTNYPELFWSAQETVFWILSFKWRALDIAHVFWFTGITHWEYNCTF